jgi:hypothetical protein
VYLKLLAQIIRVVGIVQRILNVFGATHNRLVLRGHSMEERCTAMHGAGNSAKVNIISSYVS